MKVYQPELIVITKPENSTNETYQIIEMFQKGLAVLHLRKPTLSEDETIEFLTLFLNNIMNELSFINIINVLTLIILKGFTSQKPLERTLH